MTINLIFTNKKIPHFSLACLWPKNADKQILIDTKND